MPDRIISSLSAGSAVAANDRFVAVETPGVGPVTKTGLQLKEWIGGGGGSSSSDPLGLSQYDGVADCTAELQTAINTCFGSAGSPHGSANAKLNKPFILPPGQFNITSPLMVTKVRGGLIRGAGRFATTITNTAGSAVFITNGFEYSRVEGMKIEGSGSTTELFELDWDGSTGPALQSNTFFDMYFQGGQWGVTIGDTGYMGSENLFIQCFFSGQAGAGLSTWNFNALQNSVIGGNFQSCGIGIQAHQGSVPNIMGVGFQVNGRDIQVDNSANDTYCINGCRTESANFATLNNGPTVSLMGCTQINATAGDFAIGGANLVLLGCQSLNGRVSSAAFNRVRVDACIFSRSDWKQGGAAYIVDGIGPVITKNSNFTLNNYATVNGLIIGNSIGSPWSLTIPSEANMFSATGLVIPVGVGIDVIQNDTAQITVAADTGVTMHSARSFTTRAQYSAIRLTKIGADEWLVSGDLT
jgi:hypothetical protein